MSKDEPSSLLSKMAKLVRSPGAPKADAIEDVKEAAKPAADALSKQDLKDMIEQRRRNDFVRRREFDMLRKVRAAGGAAHIDAAALPSFFETSTPSPLDDKDGTIKKIDDIEALMSEQWSDRKSTPRGRVQQTVAQNTEAQSTQDLTPPTAASPLPAAAHLPPMEPTAPMPLRPPNLAPLAPTAPMMLMPMPAPIAAARALDMLDISNPELARVPVAKAPSGARPAAMPIHSAPPPAAPPAANPAAPGAQTIGALGPKDKDYVFDQDMEELAIRFGSGDDDAAVEAALIAALAPGSPKAKDDEAWLTLFDFYRMVGNHARFDTAAIDYAGRFEKSAPIWYSVPELLGKAASGGVAVQAGASSGWTSPAIFGLQSAAALNAALTRLPQPWNLNWGKLNKIDDTALAALEKLVASWCMSKVQMRFSGAARLLEVVAARTPNGDAAVNQGWWRLHMFLQRLMHRPDEFEVVALDFCVTYEVSPPQWEKALCNFKSLDSEGATMMAASTRIPGADAQESMLSIMPQITSVDLSGSLTGDAAKAIQQIDAQLEGASILVISCGKLMRADFTAAGALLNWAATHQAEGHIIQFRSVNRLVAAFFHVIGIHEHARILVSTL